MANGDFILFTLGVFHFGRGKTSTKHFVYFVKCCDFYSFSVIFTNGYVFGVFQVRKFNFFFIELLKTRSSIEIIRSHSTQDGDSALFTAQAPLRGEKLN